MMRDVRPLPSFRQPPRLKTQLWTGARPEETAFTPPTNDGFTLRKPRGGLWTSTYDPRYGSDWIQWCLAEDFRGPTFRCWLLEPDPTALVLEIDSYQDLERTHSRYGLVDPAYADHPFGHTLDFEAIARDYDAIHLTAAGQHRTRLTRPLTLYGWDSESVLALRWIFVGEPIDLGRPTFAKAHSD